MVMIILFQCIRWSWSKLSRQTLLGEIYLDILDDVGGYDIQLEEYYFTHIQMQ